MKRTSTLTHLYIFICVLITTGAASAQSIDESVLQQLNAEGEFVQYYFDDDKPDHIPLTPMYSELQDQYENMKITVGVEVFFKIPAPDGFVNSAEDHLILYNLIHRVSRLEGIEYFSVRRNRMRIFFKQAYLIASPESDEPLSDTVFSSVPPVDTRYIFQEDSTFGKNISRAEYVSDGSILSMQITNLTTMKYFIPVVSPGGSVMTLQILPDQDEIIFYGVIGVDSISILGIEKAKKESYYNRLKAMYSWFHRELLLEYP